MSSGSPYSTRRSISCTGDWRRSSAHRGYGSRTPRAIASSNAWNGSTAASVIASRFSSQPVSEDELLHLARRRAREVVDEPELLGPLLAGEAGGGEVRPHRLQVDGRGAGKQPHERTPVLSEPCVRRGDDRGLRHPGYAQEQLLDLGGAHVLTAPDDDVLLPVGDREVTLLVEHADVATHVPAVVDEGGGGERWIGVPREAVGAPAEDLARDADLHVATRFVDQPEVDSRKRAPVGELALLGIVDAVDAPRGRRMLGRPVHAD